MTNMENSKVILETVRGRLTVEDDLGLWENALTVWGRSSCCVMTVRARIGDGYFWLVPVPTGLGPTIPAGTQQEALYFRKVTRTLYLNLSGR
jgi:hypothetical protein